MITQSEKPVDCHQQVFRFGGVRGILPRAQKQSAGLFFAGVAVALCKRKITCTYQRAARYEIMEWEVAERFGKWRNVPEYSETALEG